jgi:hypothetical protein
VEEASAPGSTIALDAVIAQTDELILAVTRALEGEKEVEIVRYLLRLRDSVAAYGKRDATAAQVETARQEVINLVNNFFYEKLTAIPAIRAYMEERMQAAQ